MAKEDVTTRERSGDEETTHTHESYGIISLARIHGGGGCDLFMSPVRPPGAMMITISTARRHHDSICGDLVMDDKILLELEMSETQFATAITTLNSGPGTPCTLKLRAEPGSKLMECEPPPPQMSEARGFREKFLRDIGAKRASLRAVRRRIGTLLERPKPPNKAERDEVLHEIDQLIRLFEDSAPFVMERFEESTAATVAAAKGELAAFADNLVRSTGLAALKAGADVPELEETAGQPNSGEKSP